MLGFYLILVVFGQFVPESLLGALSPAPIELTLQVSDASGITINTPVLMKGQTIGTVTNIASPEEINNYYQVSLKLRSPIGNIIRSGTIALITSMSSNKSGEPEKVVELLIPPDNKAPVLQNDATIWGYASYEEFWSADFSKLGFSYDPFAAG